MHICLLIWGIIVKMTEYQGQVTLASNRDNSLVPLRTSCETVYRQTPNHETPLKGLQWGL